jgi:hypothetical protein
MSERAYLRAGRGENAFPPKQIGSFAPSWTASTQVPQQRHKPFVTCQERHNHASSAIEMRMKRSGSLWSREPHVGRLHQRDGPAVVPDRGGAGRHVWHRGKGPAENRRQQRVGAHAATTSGGGVLVLACRGCSHHVFLLHTMYFFTPTLHNNKGWSRTTWMTPSVAAPIVGR